MSLSPDRHLYFNASDAPAMLGISPHETRQALLERIKYGISKPITPAVQAIFDAGHRIEALARPIAEALAGHPLPPKRFTRGNLGATLDGYYLDAASLDSINWECKTLNDAIRAAFASIGAEVYGHFIASGVRLPEYLLAQMEHQLICSEADKCLFTAYKDGKAVHCWYYSDPVMRRRIVDGWAQFERDLSAMPDVMPQAIVGELMPVVREFPFMPLVGFGIVRGSLQDVVRFEKEGREFVSTINQNLVTDQDFADGESDKTNLAEAVKLLDALLDAPQDMAALKRVRDLFNKARISLENQLTTRKQARKTELIKAAQWTYSSHITALDVAEYMPLVNVDFAAAIKGKSSFAAMKNTLDAELLRAISGSNSVAARIRENLALIAQANEHYLFPDSRALVLKEREDLKNLIAARLATAKAAAEAQARAKVAEDAENARVTALPAIEFMTAFAPAIDPPSVITITTPAPLVADVATINIGQISARLGFAVTRVFLEQLGFMGVRVGSLHKYLESDFPKIVAAIIEHLRGVK